ncbi:hypothetical protein Z043_121229 [Scleropages formosus]|uniref:Uncharacterized protein n=1 Tax=Scleropages formosus TaxID=113540 RepID=A0A0P7TSS7_SCLFO|nr:hypothetical protein Z043_121229 [Scleropages formosus]
MIQNMFQEGLYHVFLSERPQPHAQAAVSNLEDLKDARIVRWFGTVVNTRFLVTGVIILMGLNLFCLLLGVSSLVTYGLRIAAEPSPMSQEQRIGAYVARGSAIFFTVQCVLGSFYILFLSWRGLRRYSPPYRQAYYPVSQVGSAGNDSSTDQDDRMELIPDDRDQSL